MILFAIKVWQAIPTEAGYNVLSWKMMVGGFSLHTYLIIGIVLVIAQLCYFYRSSLGPTYKEFSDLFIRMKAEEKLTPQGMCWKEDAEKIGYYTYNEESQQWDFVKGTGK